jgi:hypothetical protein
MSRRSQRRRKGRAATREGADGAAAGRPPTARESAPPARVGGRRAWGLGVQIGFLVAVFAVVALVAELAGAANLGVALGIGQVAFAIVVVYLLLRR